MLFFQAIAHSVAERAPLLPAHLPYPLPLTNCAFGTKLGKPSSQRYRGKFFIVTPEERRLLTDLAGKVSQTPPPPRDPEAEDFIRKNIGSRPDALYLMTQTVLVQNMAIEQAQQQIRDLQQRLAQQPAAGYAGSGAGTGSFLGAQAGAYSQPQPQYAPQQAPAYASPQPPASGFGGGGAPSFLRGAAQTAAGVAAGALAFEGVRSLFSHPGFGLGSGLGFGQTGFMGGGMPMEETVVNNYYDSPEGGGRGFGQHSEHLANVSDDSSGDQSDSNSDDDDVQTQDADYDDSSDTDDSSSFDDSSDSIA